MVETSPTQLHTDLHAAHVAASDVCGGAAEINGTAGQLTDANRSDCRGCRFAIAVVVVCRGHYVDGYKLRSHILARHRSRPPPLSAAPAFGAHRDKFLSGAAAFSDARVAVSCGRSVTPVALSLPPKSVSEKPRCRLRTDVNRDSTGIRLSELHDVEMTQSPYR